VQNIFQGQYKMKNFIWILFFTFTVSVFGFLYAHNKGYCAEATVNSALDAARDVRSQVDSKEKLNSRLNVPATSDTIQMETFGTHEKFDATIMCPGAGPIISVQMFPEDSLAGSGEVKLIASYDLNQDGNFDQTVQARHVGGICGDGFIANCSPRGSFNDCEYYKWMYEDGMIVAKNKIQVSEDEPLRDVVLVDLHGCFCFNRSCSNAILGNVDQVLTYFASGIKDIMRQNNQDFVITKVDLNPAMMTLDYIGANISDCNTNLDSVSQDKTVQELSSLDSSLGFGEESAVELALSDLGDPFTVLSNSVGQTHVTRQCTIEADVSTTGEMVNVVRKMEDINFYVAQDEHESEVCFSVTPQNSLIEAYGNMGWEECVARQIPSELDNICLHASAGYFSQIIETENEEALSGYISVWGQRHPLCGSMGIADCAFQRWKVDCKGIHATDSFQCYSPSMSLENGETIYNDPFNEHLYQGCTIVKPPKNNCVALEANPDCELKDEIIDGVQTVKDGVRTNLNPMRSCRTFSGVDRAITVCETGWETTRTYTCVTDSNFDFSKEMERADHIDQNLVYNKNGGDWSSQGDIRFDENGVRTEVVFDPDLQFNTKMESCEPACLVSYDAPNTGITLDGEEIVTSNATKEIYESRLCEKSGESYVCPVSSGERIETDCTCFDQNAFVEAIAELTTIKESSLDMICSSGEKQGICNPDEEGIETQYVACMVNPGFDENNEFIGEYHKCLPNMWWRKSPLQNQTHRIYATEDYRCRAEVPGLSESEGEADTDYVENDLGEMTPLSAWFNPVVNWAKPLIIDHLKTDPEFIPDPGPGCPCGGGSSSTSIGDGSGGTYDCEWTVETSVNNINRLDNLVLDSTSQTPFGNVELYFSSTGSWGGSHNVPCQAVQVRETATSYPSLGKCVSASGVLLRNENNNNWWEGGTRYNSYWGAVESWVLVGPNEVSTGGEHGRRNVNLVRYCYYQCFSYAMHDYLDGDHGWPRYPETDDSLHPVEGVTIQKEFNISGHPRPDSYLYTHEKTRSFWPDRFIYPNGNPFENTNQRTVYTRGQLLNEYTSAGFSRVKTFQYQYNLKVYGNGYKCTHTGRDYTTRSACLNNCQTESRYQCEGGDIVTNPALCPMKTVYLCPANNVEYPTLHKCENVCIQDVSCNAQSDDYRFKATIKNPGTNIYSQELDLVEPENRHIDSAVYTHENLILQQCIDRYMKKYINFDDAETGFHFEHKLADFLIYAASAIKNNELPIDIDEGNHPGRLPRIPPAYTAVYSE
jgi:hypothetical protein